MRSQLSEGEGEGESEGEGEGEGEGQGEGEGEGEVWGPCIQSKFFSGRYPFFALELTKKIQYMLLLHGCGLLLDRETLM